MNDQDVIEKLIKYDPYADDFPRLDYLLKVRTAILNKYGIGHLHEGLTFQDILKALFVFKGYTLAEKINWFLGADFSMIYLFPVLLKDNFFESSVKFEIPFYIIQGVYDYQVSYVLAEKYLDILEAPKKEFFTFNNSAHSPNMEEPEKFIQILRKIALENQLQLMEKNP
jgi:pimeloyl-ACP methyl ester carboxylesterase